MVLVKGNMLEDRCFLFLSINDGCRIRLLFWSLLLGTGKNSGNFLWFFFYFKNSCTLSQSYTHSVLPCTVLESPRAINISFSASKCIKWELWSGVRACIHLPFNIWDLCVWFRISTNTAKLPSALLCCVLSWEAHRLLEGCIQKDGGFF